eukprot:7793427-Alexandrium_andersonii.AAC.1
MQFPGHVLAEALVPGAWFVQEHGRYSPRDLTVCNERDFGHSFLFAGMVAFWPAVVSASKQFRDVGA